MTYSIITGKDRDRYKDKGKGMRRDIIRGGVDSGIGLTFRIGEWVFDGFHGIWLGLLGLGWVGLG